MNAISAYAWHFPALFTPPTKPQARASCFTSATCSVFLGNPTPSISKLKRIGCSVENGFQRLRVCCNGSTNPSGPGSADGENKSILDAFFLGKALAEALTERIESSLGELASEVGRLQAEQQKQLQVFQEEIIERAKKAKDQAARDAIESRELLSTSTSGFSTPLAKANASSDQSSSAKSETDPLR